MHNQEHLNVLTEVLRTEKTPYVHPLSAALFAKMWHLLNMATTAVELIIACRRIFYSWLALLQRRSQGGSEQVLVAHLPLNCECFGVKYLRRGPK